MNGIRWKVLSICFDSEESQTAFHDALLRRLGEVPDAPNPSLERVRPVDSLAGVKPRSEIYSTRAIIAALHLADDFAFQLALAFPTREG